MEHKVPREGFEDTYQFGFFGKDFPENKIKRLYVNEDRYNEIKSMGEHDERNVKGVTALVDHSHDWYEEFVIIKTPRYE